MTPMSHARPASAASSAYSVAPSSGLGLDAMFEASKYDLPVYPLETATMLAQNIAGKQPRFRKRRTRTGVYKRSEKVTVESLKKKKITKDHVAKRTMGLTRN